MSRAAVSALVESAYLSILGLTLLLAPNALLPPFGFSPTSEVWIRVVGALSASFGWYGIAAVRSENLSYFRASIPQRIALCIAFIGLVAAGRAKPALILFGAVEAAGALWTWWALRYPKALGHG